LEKIWPILVTMIIALLAVAIAYRVKPLHQLVFGKGSMKVNEAAKQAVAASTPAMVTS
jgi:hypothetical protein